MSTLNKQFSDKKAQGMKKHNEVFSARLNDAIIDSDLSRKEICSQTGIAESLLSDYLKGVKSPSYLIFQKLVKVLGLPYEYLYGETPSKEPKNKHIANLLGLSDKAIKALKKMKLYNELRSTSEMLDNGLSIDDIAEKMLSHNDNRTVNVVNFLLENYIDTPDLFGIRSNGVIATLENYFYYQPPEDIKVTLSDSNVQACGRGKIAIGGVTFPAERLANVLLLEIEMQLQNCRKEYQDMLKGGNTDGEHSQG